MQAPTLVPKPSPVSGKTRDDCTPQTKRELHVQPYSQAFTTIQFLTIDSNLATDLGEIAFVTLTGHIEALS